MLKHNELIYGVRMMRRHPGFASAAILTLAVAIATMVLVLEVADTVMFRSLPVQDPGALVILRWEQRKPLPGQIRQQWTGFQEDTSFSYPFFESIQRSGIFANLFGFAPIDTSFTRTKIDGHETVPRGEAVTPAYFGALGIQPQIGRVIEPGAVQSAERVIDISYGFWTSKFGRDPSVVGKSISFHHIPYTIIGVTPPEFTGTESGQAPDFWVPVQQWPDTQGGLLDRRNWWITIIGRLKPHASLQTIQSRLQLLFWQELQPETGTQISQADLPQLRIDSGRRGVDLLQNKMGQPTSIAALVGIVAFLIAACNVGILMLARAFGRDKEILIRLSLGAPRGAIVRQFFLESFFLSASGGVVGVLLAYLANQTVRGMLAQLEPVTDLKIVVAPGLFTIVFSTVIILFTGIICGTIPAYYIATRVARSAMKENEVSGRISRTGKLTALILTAQTSFAVLLVLISGLLIRTLHNLEHQDMGFNPRHLLLFSVNAAHNGYRGVALLDFYERLQRHLAAVPTVTSVSSSIMTLGSTSALALPISIPGHPHQGPMEPALINLVGPDYFRTMEMALLAGRGLTWEDMAASNKPAVINQAIAQHYFPGQNPVGQRLALGPLNQFEIVGVAGNVKGANLRAGSMAQVYLPLGAMMANLQTAPDGLSFELRTRGNPGLIAGPVRDAVASLDRNVKPESVTTQMDQINSVVAVERIVARIASFFGLLILVLTAISVYAVQSHSVERRTREIGIRISLGSNRRMILLLILWRFWIVLLPGLIIGLVAAFAVGKLLTSELYQVRPTDHMTAIVSIGTVAFCSLLGALIPAQRAASVDPIVALRME